MKNKLPIIAALIMLFIIICCLIYINYGKKNNSNYISNTQITEDITTDIADQNTMTDDKESEGIMNTTIKITINNKKYNAYLEQNETAKQFINMLPQELNMNELNGNEKYINLDYNLPTNSYNPKRIEAGDIMLYGNNCLVVFYKSFDTAFSYTKIGHIDNLPNLGNKNVTIKFEK